MQRCHLSKFVHLGWAEIADADRADLAGAMQCAHGFRDFRNRCVRIGPVNLVEIDGVSLQPAQGILDLRDETCLSSISEWLAILPVEAGLCCDNCPTASSANGQ